MGCLPVLVHFKGGKAVSPRRPGLSARTGCRQARGVPSDSLWGYFATLEVDQDPGKSTRDGPR